MNIALQVHLSFLLPAFPITPNRSFSASDQGMPENMNAYLDCAVSTMKDFGGPSLDKEVLRMQFTLTALQQMCLDAMVMV